MDQIGLKIECRLLPAKCAGKPLLLIGEIFAVLVGPVDGSKAMI